MGKNIVLFVLLLLMLAGAVWQSAYVHRATDTLIAPLEQAIQALEQNDTEKAAQFADEFEAAWRQEKNTYEALFEHKEVDTISAYAKTLKSMCAPSTIPQAKALAGEMLFYVDHIRAIDCMGWENIF